MKTMLFKTSLLAILLTVSSFRIPDTQTAQARPKSNGLILSDGVKIIDVSSPSFWLQPIKKDAAQIPVCKPTIQQVKAVKQINAAYANTRKSDRKKELEDFRTESFKQARQEFKKYSKAIGVASDSLLLDGTANIDKMGIKHIWMKQRHGKAQVYGSGFGLQIIPGGDTKIISTLKDSINLPGEAAISAETAEQNALQHAKADTFLTLPAGSKFIKGIDTTLLLTDSIINVAITNANVVNKGKHTDPKLIIFTKANLGLPADTLQPYILCWQFYVETYINKKRFLWNYLINALDGNIVRRRDGFLYATAVVKGYRSLSTEMFTSPQSVDFVTRDTETATSASGWDMTHEIHTYNNNDTDSFLTNYCISMNNNLWGDFPSYPSRSTNEHFIVDAHRYLEDAINYFHNLGIIRLYSSLHFHANVHAGASYLNKIFYDWPNQSIFIGDGDGVDFDFMGSYDLIVHEFVHSIYCDLLGDSSYSNEEHKTIVESIADCFGWLAALEKPAEYPEPTKIGSRTLLTGRAKNIASPSVDGVNTIDTTSDATIKSSCDAGLFPDHYSIRYTTMDDSYSYCNNAIISHAFYLLAEGGTHRLSNITVTPIGHDLVEAILFNVFYNHFWESYDISSFRQVIINYVMLTYNADHATRDTLVSSVKTAFKAVGIGPDLFVRDSLLDIGVEPGIASCMSPDIFNRQINVSAEANVDSVKTLFRNPSKALLSQPLKKDQDNYVYFRIFNAGSAPASGTFKLYIAPEQAQGDQTKWIEAGSCPIPAFAGTHWNSVDAALENQQYVKISKEKIDEIRTAFSGNNKLGLIGIIESASDPAPAATLVTTKEKFDNQLSKSNNYACYLPAIKVSATSLAINKDAGSTVPFNIQSNTNWKVLSNKSWLTPNKTAGSDSAVVILTTQANPKIYERTATITVMVPDMDTIHIEVTQAPALPFILASPVSCSIAPAVNSQTTVNIYSNTDWTISDNQVWLATDKPTGADTSTVTLTARGNPKTYDRTATVKAMIAGVDTVDIAVTQLAAAPFISISQTSLPLGAGLNSTAGFTVFSNTAWNVSSDKTWLSALPTSGNDSAAVVLTAQANPKTYTRTATVKTMITGVDTVDVLVTQAAAVPFLLVNPASQTIPSVLNSQTTFTICSNTAWNVNVDQSWITADKTSGSDSAVITLTAKANLKAYNRKSTVSVILPGIDTVKVTVTQTGASPSFSVNTNNLHLGSASNSAALFNIYSNAQWTVSSDKSWLTPNLTNGIDSASIILTALENHKIVERIATVTIMVPGVDTAYITITQEAGSPVITSSHASLNIGAASNNTSGFTVYSNSTWNVSSDKTWLSVNPTSGTDTAAITLTAKANPGIAERKATVKALINGIDTVFVSVTQAAGTPFITCSHTNLNIGESSNSTSGFTVYSNTTWNVSSDKVWLTMNPTSGTDTTAITLTVQANPGVVERKATVKAMIPGVDTVFVSVTQAAGTPFITSSHTKLNIGEALNSTSGFTVNSNTNWEISSDKSWLTMNPKSGADTIAITLTAQANTSITERNATVQVRINGIDTVFISVVQEAASPILTVTPESLSLNALSNSTGTFEIYSNTSWSITNNQTWLSVTPATGTDSSKITVKAGANQSSVIRLANISISANGIENTIVSISQKAGIIDKIESTDNSIAATCYRSGNILHIENITAGSLIMLVNSEGKTLFKEQAKKSNLLLNINNFAKGIYSIVIFNNNYKQTIKVVF